MKKARVIITALFTIIIMSCCTYAESTANKNAKNAYEKYVNEVTRCQAPRTFCEQAYCVYF